MTAERSTAQLRLDTARLLSKKASDCEAITADIGEVKLEIIRLEEELLATGSTKTMDECQQEREQLTEQLQVLAMGQHLARVLLLTLLLVQPRDDKRSV